MERFIIVTASAHNRKYFINPDFADIPKDILQELRETAIVMSEIINGLFTIGFYNDGSVFLETSGQENDFDYDEIGAALEVERLKRQKKQLIESLSLWYDVFRSDKGKEIRSVLIKNRTIK